MAGGGVLVLVHRRRRVGPRGVDLRHQRRDEPAARDGGIDFEGGDSSHGGVRRAAFAPSGRVFAVWRVGGCVCGMCPGCDRGAECWRPARWWWDVWRGVEGV